MKKKKVEKKHDEQVDEGNRKSIEQKEMNIEILDKNNREEKEDEEDLQEDEGKREGKYQ